MFWMAQSCSGTCLTPRGCMRTQEHKWRRQQKLDNAPPWSVQEEERLAQAVNAASRAMLFCVVKH